MPQVVEVARNLVVNSSKVQSRQTTKVSNPRMTTLQSEIQQKDGDDHVNSSGSNEEVKESKENLSDEQLDS